MLWGRKAGHGSEPLRVSSAAGDVVALCAPEVAQAGEFLLSLVAAEAAELKDGYRMRFGWTIITVRRIGRDWIVHEPDYEGDPNVLRRDVTKTLTVQLAMNDVATRAGLDEPDPPGFWQSVMTKPGALREQRIFATREGDREPDDSGWYVGPVADPDGGAAQNGDEQYRVLPVYGVLRERPALLPYLCLPAGYLVAMDGDDLCSVVGADGNEIMS